MLILSFGSMFASVGTFLLKLLLLILILGIIILVHEFGHFMWAKKFKVHIYEFSIGMGPILFTHKGKKDKIDYNIRAVPIGGFVSMAGEVYDDDDKIAKKDLMCNKPWWQRLIIMVAGVTNNFIMAIILIIISACIWGGSVTKPVINDVLDGSAAENAGLRDGDTIKSINGYKVGSWDKAQIILYYKNKKNYYTFEVVHKDGVKETLKITPDVENEGTKEERKVFGISMQMADTSNIIKATGYGFKKFSSTISSMFYTITGLITGKISLNALSGPVGIFEVVGDSVGMSIGDAIAYVVSLLSYLSINVGFINILPFPAFDGGHVLFIIIEKIKGSPVDGNIETICHTIGFALIFLLMIIVTINDIIKLF